MTEKFIRHFISVIATVIAMLIFWAGYIAGGLGWWFAAFAVFVVYFIVFALIEV